MKTFWLSLHPITRFVITIVLVALGTVITFNFLKSFLQTELLIIAACILVAAGLFELNARHKAGSFQSPAEIFAWPVTTEQWTFLNKVTITLVISFVASMVIGTIIVCNAAIALLLKPQFTFGNFVWLFLIMMITVGGMVFFRPSYLKNALEELKKL